MSQTGVWFRRLGVAGILVAALVAYEARARDAAFLDPGNTSTAVATDAIRVEPKGDIDTGESVLNVSKHTTLFFVNQTSSPVQVEKIAVNGDGNVTAEIAADDCSKQGTLTAQSRCSVEVSITPTSAGTWSAEVVMTHNGAGRLARAKLSGKTTGAAAVEKKDMGLTLNSKDNKPVDFGEVTTGGGKAVRSALMVNDSPDPITLYSIDVIAADNGLTRLEQGCAVDMELKPGESCPVTLLWTPTDVGQISTDLIIRHSGKLGFAVVSVRGTSKSTAPSKDAKGDQKSASGETGKSSTSSPASPAPPSADDLAKAMKMPTVSADLLGGLATAGNGSFRLIGTVGNRAVLLKPDGTTSVADVGDEIEVGEAKAKVLAVSARSAEILYEGKKKDLVLGAAPELTARAKNASTESGLSGVPGSLASGATLPVASSTPLPASATGGLGSK